MTLNNLVKCRHYLVTESSHSVESVGGIRIYSYFLFIYFSYYSKINIFDTGEYRKSVG